MLHISKRFQHYSKKKKIKERQPRRTPVEVAEYYDEHKQRDLLLTSSLSYYRK